MLAEQQQLDSCVTQDEFRHSSGVYVTCVLASLRTQHAITVVISIKWKKIDLKPKKMLQVTVTHK